MIYGLNMDIKVYTHIVSLGTRGWVELQCSGHSCVSPNGKPANQYSPLPFTEPHLNFLHILFQSP